MEEKQYKLELGFKELCLIEKALELYGRVGMLQFEYLTLCGSLQSLIWKKHLSEEFRNKGDLMKGVFGYSPSSNPGIFNKEHVGDDCRNAIHMYQVIRHQRYLDQLKKDPKEDSHHGVDKYPANTCELAGMESPEFKFLDS